MSLEFWIQVTGKLQGINDWLFNHRQMMALIIHIHEANVKGRIMGDKNTALTKGLEFF